VDIGYTGGARLLIILIGSLGQDFQRLIDLLEECRNAVDERRAIICIKIALLK
jgi:hypothetical protein